MTAKTSELLAQALESVGLTAMAATARADQYHDYLADDAMSAINLSNDLTAAIERTSDPILRGMIKHIRDLHHSGAFDASKEESDDWAASPEGIEAFSMLVKGK